MNISLHDALVAQGIVSFDSSIVGKRSLVSMPTCRPLGDFSAAEAWEGLNNGLLVYRKPAK